MKKLIINTQFPDVVHTLLLRYELVEQSSIKRMSSALSVDYLGDTLSQEIVFWFCMAVGCGLIHDYYFEKPQSKSVHIQGSVTGSAIITGNNSRVYYRPDGRDERA